MAVGGEDTSLFLSPGRCNSTETGLALCVFGKCSHPSVLCFLANKRVLILIWIASDLTDLCLKSRDLFYFFFNQKATVVNMDVSKYSVYLLYILIPP